MYIQKSNQVLHLTLPEFHWLSPVLKVPLTPENAHEYGYVPVFDFFNVGITAHVQAVTSSVGFDDISRCALVLPESPFYTAAQALIAWYNAVWEKVATDQALLLAGQREFVPLDEYIAELPKLGE